MRGLEFGLSETFFVDMKESIDSLQKAEVSTCISWQITSGTMFQECNTSPECTDQESSPSRVRGHVGCRREERGLLVEVSRDSWLSIS